MKRKALVLAMCMAFSTPVFSARNTLPINTVGLNLGEIQSTTFLNEPFNGKIPILFSSKADARLLKVRLAPASIFAQIGAERLPLLSDLDFNIAVINNKPVIKISSINAINHPFLNFVIEIERKQGGKTYQDFTVMLDPRESQKKLPKNQLNNQIIERKNKVLLPATHSSSSLLSKGNQTRYTVQAGDSLSKIAHELKASGISLNNIIKGILLKNPDSFSDINKIGKGEVINLPTFSELRGFSTLIKEASQLGNKTETAITQSTISYKVNKGDTLYKITKMFLRNGTSFTKFMNLIHIKNPHAFSQNRINILIAGTVLEIPSIDKKFSQNKLTSTKTQQQNKQSKLKVPATSSAHNNTNTISSPDQIIVSNAKNENGNQLKRNRDIIQSLENRVRKLRNKLSKATNDFSSLESTLSNNEHLLLEQQNEVKKLKSTISSLKEVQLTSKTLSEASEVAAAPNKATETPALSKTTNNLSSSDTKTTLHTNINIEALETNESIEAMIITELLEIAEDQQSTMNQGTTGLFEALETFKTTKSIEIPEAIKVPTNSGAIKKSDNIELSGTPIDTDHSESNYETVISKIEKLYASKGVSYALLLLILGILAIRFRKKSQAYTSIPNNQPTFYKEDKYTFTEDKYSFTEKTEHKVATENNHHTNIAHTHKNDNKISIPDIPTANNEIKPPNHTGNSFEEKRTYKDVPDLEIQVSEVEIQECEVLVDNLLGELLEELEGSPESTEQELSENDSFLKASFDEDIDSIFGTDRDLAINTQTNERSENYFIEEEERSGASIDLLDNTLDEYNKSILKSKSTEGVANGIEINASDQDASSTFNSNSYSLDDFQNFQSDLLTTTHNGQLALETPENKASIKSVFDDLTNFEFNEEKVTGLDKGNNNFVQQTTEKTNNPESSDFNNEKTA